MIALAPVSTYECDFAGLVRKHQAMVFSLAWHYLRDRAVAEEVAQEVFFGLHRNIASIESDAHAASWLRKVVVQRAIDEGRRRIRQPQTALEELPPLATPGAPGDPLLRETLRRLVAALPEGPRMAMVLRYQEDLDPAEIAEVLGMPVATVKSHLHRSLGLLREKLTRCGVGSKQGDK